MNKVFCVSCGSKILYEITKPKFCSSCGEPIGSVSASSKREEVEEETGQLEVDIDKLKRDIKVEGNTQGNTLQDLWSSVSQSEAQAGGLGGDFSRPASSEPDGQELLDKIQRDCASSRMRDIDES